MAIWLAKPSASIPGTVSRPPDYPPGVKPTVKKKRKPTSKKRLITPTKKKRPLKSPSNKRTTRKKKL